MDAKVGIIGAGPAGVAAAVQLKRFDISSIIFEKDRIGGLIRNAHRVENTMLFPDGITGKEFVDRLIDYSKKYSLTIKKETAVNISTNTHVSVTTDAGEYTFRYLIVATGTRPKKLPFPEFKYHVTEIGECNSILIVGGGDIALDYALTAAEQCDEVIILHRSALKALPALQKEVAATPRIKLVHGELKSVHGHTVKTTAGVFYADELLGAIGRIPNIEIAERVTHPGVYLAGDVKNGIYRQSSIAIADGIRIAMNIWRRETYGNP